MAISTGAYNTYEASGKENFRDLLALMKTVDTRGETPVLDKLGTSTANGVYHEWSYFNRTAPAGGHGKLEGEDTTFSALTSPTMAINYVETIESPFKITREQELAQRAGGPEVAFRKKDAFIHLKSMLEFEVIWASGVSGNQSTARYMKGLLSILSMVTNASNPTMTEANFTAYLKQIWNSTSFGMMTIYADTALADNIDTYSSSITKYREQGAKKLVTYTKTVDSAYGQFDVYRHRRLATTKKMIAIDTEMFKVAYYDKPRLIELAKSGDYTAMVYNVRATLEALNPLAGIAVTNA